MPQQLTITLTDEGSINVNGPINNKVLSFGLLECAKDAIREFHENQTKRVAEATSADIAALVSGPAAS